MTTHEDAAITDAPYPPLMPTEPPAAEATPEGPRHAGFDDLGRLNLEKAAPAAETTGKRAKRVKDGPSWWHRGHPVFTPLAGFFTGLVLVIAMPLTFAAILTALLPDDKVTTFLPVGAVVLVVPLVLLVPKGTRRFARYMLIGMVATAVVAAASAALTFWILYARSG